MRSGHFAAARYDAHWLASADPDGRPNEKHHAVQRNKIILLSRPEVAPKVLPPPGEARCAGTVRLLDHHEREGPTIQRKAQDLADNLVYGHVYDNRHDDHDLARPRSSRRNQRKIWC